MKETKHHVHAIAKPNLGQHQLIHDIGEHWLEIDLMDSMWISWPIESIVDHTQSTPNKNRK